MTRGPRPQPAAIKRAKGNPSRRKIAEPEQLPTEAAPADAIAPRSTLPAPKQLTAAQREVWEAFVPELVGMRLMKATDIAAFGRYCAWTVKWNEAERRMRTAKLVTVTESEHVVMERMSKWLMVMVHIDKRLEAIEERFGMNPSARQRIFQQLANQNPQLPLGGGAQAPADATKPAPAAAPTLPMTDASPVGLLN